MSNKKFFSHGLEQSAIDVIYKKKGHELLRYYRENIPGSVMKSFPSYEQFILLLRTFYFSPIVKPYNIQVLQSLRNTNSSFILYNNIKTHVSSCSSCQEHPVVLFNRCIVLKQILYPYGLYISDDLNNKDFHMHNGLNLRDLCVKCPDVFFLNNHHDDREGSNKKDSNKKEREEREREKREKEEREKETINYESSLFLQENPDLYNLHIKNPQKKKLCKCTGNLFVGPLTSIDRKPIPRIKEKGRGQGKNCSTCCG